MTGFWWPRTSCRQRSQYISASFLLNFTSFCDFSNSTLALRNSLHISKLLHLLICCFLIRLSLLIFFLSSTVFFLDVLTYIHLPICKKMQIQLIFEHFMPCIILHKSYTFRKYFCLILITCILRQNIFSFEAAYNVKYEEQANMGQVFEKSVL